MAADYQPASWVGSPNFGYPTRSTGRKGQPVIAIVNHIAEGSRAGARSWFSNPQSGASAHYLVCKEGEIDQFVREDDAAWANGIDFNQGHFPDELAPALRAEMAEAQRRAGVAAWCGSSESVPR